MKSLSQVIGCDILYNNTYSIGYVHDQIYHLYIHVKLVDWISIGCGYKLFTTGVSSSMMAVGGE